MTLQAFCSRLKFVAMLLSSLFILADSCGFDVSDAYYANFQVTLTVRNNCLAAAAGAYPGAFIKVLSISYTDGGVVQGVAGEQLIPFGRTAVINAAMSGKLASVDGEVEPTGPPPTIQIDAYLLRSKNTDASSNVHIGGKNLPIKHYYFRDDIRLQTSINEIDSGDGAVQCLTIRY